MGSDLPRALRSCETPKTNDGGTELTRYIIGGYPVAFFSMHFATAAVSSEAQFFCWLRLRSVSCLRFAGFSSLQVRIDQSAPATNREPVIRLVRTPISGWVQDNRRSSRMLNFKCRCGVEECVLFRSLNSTALVVCFEDTKNIWNFFEHSG